MKQRVKTMAEKRKKENKKISVELAGVTLVALSQPSEGWTRWRITWSRSVGELGLKPTSILSKKPLLHHPVYFIARRFADSTGSN
jgi:hypothetical protein